MTISAEVPIACNLNAFDPEQTARHRELLMQLRSVVQNTEETEDSLIFTLPSDTETCLAVMEFITLERRCCTFLTFGVTIPPQGGPLTLTMSGPEGTKEILAGFAEAVY